MGAIRPAGFVPAMYCNPHYKRMQAQEWRRNSPLMATISSALGVAEAQMDQLFVATLGGGGVVL